MKVVTLKSVRLQQANGDSQYSGPSFMAPMSESAMELQKRPTEFALLKRITKLGNEGVPVHAGSMAPCRSHPWRVTLDWKWTQSEVIQDGKSESQVE